MRIREFSCRQAPHAFLYGGAFLFVFIALLTRNWGSFGDESGYMQYSVVAPYGDSAIYGKPVAYYFLNYHLYHFMKGLLGSLHPFGLHFAYELFSVASVIYWAKTAFNKDASLMVFVLLAVPFFLFVFSQVLMETPIVAVLFLVAAILQKEDRKKHHLLLLILITFVASLVKPNAWPAIFALLLWNGGRRPSFVLPALSVLPFLAAYGLNEWFLNLLKATRFPYVAASQGMDYFTFTFFKHRLAITVETWFYFLLPFVGVLVWPRRFLKWNYAELLGFACAVGASLAIMLVSAGDWVRYIFPQLAAGLIILISWMWACWGRRMAIVIPLGLAIFSTSMFTKNRFALWPQTMVTEMYDSAGSVFQGSHFWWQAFTNRKLREDLCLYYDREGPANYYYERFLSHFSSKVRIFHSLDDYQSYAGCRDGYKIVVNREIDPSQRCEFLCPDSSQHKDCGQQNMGILVPEHGPHDPVSIVSQYCYD